MTSVQRPAFFTRSDEGYFEGKPMHPELRAEREGQPHSA